MVESMSIVLLNLYIVLLWSPEHGLKRSSKIRLFVLSGVVVLANVYPPCPEGERIEGL